jgi:PAS domain S-box-containing protein
MPTETGKPPLQALQQYQDRLPSPSPRGPDALVRDVDGTIRFWSQGCVGLFGWTAEQAIGQSADELLRTIFPVPPEEIKAVLLHDREWRGKLRHHTREGAEVVVAVRKVMRRQADGSLAIMEHVTASPGSGGPKLLCMRARRSFARSWIPPPRASSWPMPMAGSPRSTARHCACSAMTRPRN